MPDDTRFGHCDPVTETSLRAREELAALTAHLPPWQAKFCEALRRHHGAVVLALEAARVSKQTAYRYRRESPAFKEAWEAALELGEAEEEWALFQAGALGTFVPVYDGDEIIAFEKRRSPAAAEAWLKLKRPELFK